LRRRDIDKQDRFRLNAEEMREDAELRKMIIETLARNVARISTAAYTPMEGVVTTTPAARLDADAQKAAERRQAGIDARRAYVAEQQQQQQQPPQD
jgi:peptide-N4-(N-acetyl-beta-glucosaminyl)asparagine amidase